MSPLVVNTLVDVPSPQSIRRYAMRVNLVTVLLLLTSGQAPLGAQQPAPEPTSRSTAVSAPSLPTPFGGFRLLETRIFADTMLGTHYSYGLGRHMHATVAVQPSLTLDRTPATAEYIVTRAAQSFRTLPHTTPGGIPRFEIVSDTQDTLVTGSGEYPGHIVGAKVNRGAGDRYEAWHIYFLGSRYVRVMVRSLNNYTDDPDREAVRQQVENFVRSVVPAVAAAWQL